MASSWRQLDLNGGGVQTVNLLYAQHQRHHARALLYWLGFPLGLHRIYLKQYGLAGIYLMISAGAVVAIIAANQPWWCVLITLPLALWDLVRLDAVVTNYNKALRVRLYQQQDAQPPSDFRGRELDGTRNAASSTIPSFAQQEALLRELHKTQSKNSEK